MGKKFWIAGMAAFIISLAGGIIGHGMILNAEYAQIPNLMRTEADAMNYIPHMVLSHLLKGFAFAWVYQKGVSGRPWLGQGIRYGFAMIFLITVPLYLVYFAVQPMPGILVALQIVVDTIVTFMMALAVAFVFRAVKTDEV